MACLLLVYILSNYTGISFDLYCVPRHTLGQVKNGYRNKFIN